MLGVVCVIVFIASGVLTHSLAQNDALFCGRGQLMDSNGGTRFCMTCPDGTFMAEDEHTNLSCKRCKHYLPEIDNVLQVKTCTPESDTIVEQCKEGFYVLYDSSLARYTCARCGDTDCQHNAECCSSTTVTTTVSTPKTITDVTSPPPLKPNTYQQNATKCEKVVTNGCLNAEHVNITCVYSLHLAERSVQCQKCPNINIIANNCTDTPDNADPPSLSAGAIVGIVIACIICTVVVLYCCWKRRSNKQYSIYYIVNRKPSDKTHTAAVTINCNQDEIIIDKR